MSTPQILLLIAVAIGSFWLIDRAVGAVLARDRIQRRTAAEETLRRHGMNTFVYLPSFGAQPGPVRDALTELDHTGLVVVDRDGDLVGRVLPGMAGAPRGLRLVVDNTRSAG